MRTVWVGEDGAWHTALRGRQVLADPRINKGTAFSDDERRELGVTGLIPSGHITLDGQVSRVYAQYQRQTTDLARNVLLNEVHDRNEVLYYQLLGRHLSEMLPIIYTPTVGEAIEQYSQEQRRPRGVYLSVDQPELIETSLCAPGLGAGEVDLIVATAAGAIRGIGDGGVGGIYIAVGKLAVYTAAGGINPNWTLPVMLDVGTDRQSLLDDPLYIGNRHTRVPVGEYDRFLDAFVSAVDKLFPGALLHWEDIGGTNARRPAAEVGSWQVDESLGGIGLAEVVGGVPPSILIGTSARPGAFSEPIVRAMAAHCARPVILPMSNPTSLSEAVPADLIQWTAGRALVATGSPFPPVDYDGVRYMIGQANNALVFPGLGLGVIAARATRVTERMLAAAAHAVSELVDISTPGAPLLPRMEALRETSVSVAAALADAATVEGAPRARLDGALRAHVHDLISEPDYPPRRPASPQAL